MRLIIKDIKFGKFEYTNINSVVQQIRSVMLEKMKAGKILCSTLVTNGTIVFDNVPDKDPKKLFLSEKKNHVDLPDGDPRIKKLGRKYLETHRLTLTQSDLVWKEIINGTLDNLGVSCVIAVQEFADDEKSTTVMRVGMTWGEWKYKDKSAPIEAK